MAQQVFVLWFADDGNTNLATLNGLLGGGWFVTQVTPMSGTGETGGETPQSPFPYSRAALALEDAGAGTQRAFVLWFGDEGNTNRGALNALLGQGWRVHLLAAMSGTGEHGPDTPQSGFPYSRAVVILRQ